MALVTGAQWLGALCLAQGPSPLIRLSPVLARSDLDVNNIDIPDEKIDNTEENDNTGKVFHIYNIDMKTTIILILTKSIS